jgi:alpha-ketoglutarate-dependent taurine dioxygenase
MLCEQITDRRAWRADNVGPTHSWYFDLSNSLVNSARETTLKLQREPKPFEEIRAEEYPIGACAAELAPLAAALDDSADSPGFAIVRGLPSDSSPQEQTALYWLIGQLLGRPIEQNVQGTILYDVKDTGQDVRYGARFSVTNADSSFHTDNSFGPRVLDYVGLLCLNPSKSGGINQLVSAYAAHNELLQNYPDVLRVLYEPFHVDRRGGVLADESPTIQFPIMNWDGHQLTIRYLRYWIEVGHEKACQPLTDRQREALDVLDQVVSRPELRAEFTLQARDMLFINNRWTLHNRTAFEDYEEPERKRHLVRLWVESTDGRGH